MGSLLPGWCLKVRGFALGGTWRKQWTKQGFPPKRRGPGAKTLPSLDADSRRSDLLVVIVLFQVEINLWMFRSIPVLMKLVSVRAGS